MGLFNDSVDFTVDTRPMADGIDHVAQQVNQTTGAVGVMETAVIAQEQASAKHICNKLDLGFFNVVMSQIAQRVANESAQTQAIAMELMQQQKTLQNLQTRMSNDYAMISQRYGKLFNSLNQELRNRITELDKPLMEYCTKSIKALQNRILNLVSSVPVYQSESLAASQAIAAARIKGNAQRLIQSVTNYLTNDKDEQQHTANLQVEGKTEEQQVYYVPVAVVEETTENRTAVQVKENPTLRDNVGDTAYQQIMQTVNASAPRLQWKPLDEKGMNVINVYLGMVEQAQLPDRVKEKMLAMFNDNIAVL